MKIFRRFDLLVFAILAVVAGFLGDYYITRMSSGFYYNLKNAVLLICIIRWGKWALVPVMIGSIGSIAISEFYILDSIIYYLFADLFILIPILIFGNKNRDIISSNVLNIISFVILSYVSLALGKGIAIFIVSGAYTGIIDFFATSFLQLFIDVLVILLLRTVNGLVIDMNNFFEEQKENREQI